LLLWWQSAKISSSRKHALRAFSGTVAANTVVVGKHVSIETASASRSALSKSEMDEHVRLKRELAVRRRKQLLAPLKM
jgi:hypothetical protein